MKKVTLSLVDDHVMLRNGLAKLLESMDFAIISEADNGKEFIAKLEAGFIPDVVLMDINMPVQDGFDTTSWLKTHYPLVPVLALSMYDNEYSIIRMLKCGARGFVVKDANPEHLGSAIADVISKGFHYSDLVNGKVLHAILKEDDKMTPVQKLTEREIAFLRLSATELTYQQIAAEMFVSPRTVDGYRDQLFEKLGVRSRVGLVIYAIKHQIVILK